MILSGCFWRKVVVTLIAALAFVSLYEVTALDSRYVARSAVQRDTVALPEPGVRVAFRATAYCKGFQTTSGVVVQTGIAAADPELLPVGSVVEIDSLPRKYNGVYTILDTGPSVQGRRLDLYMWSCNEALQFGQQPLHVTVLRLGWNPRASAPGFFDRFFTRPETPELAARPFPQW
jgi:3D (Asp-Asp-Asp) domain-containing protein